MPASEPFYISKGTIEHSSNCEFLLKIYHFLPFWKSLSSTKLTYTQNALRSDLRANLSLNVDVSENALPFVSQSINNFSDYDISQTHDWECPSLSPHVLLVETAPHLPRLIRLCSNHERTGLQFCELCLLHLQSSSSSCTPSTRILTVTETQHDSCRSIIRTLDMSNTLRAEIRDLCSQGICRISP